MKKLLSIAFAAAALMLSACTNNVQTSQTDIMIIGGGASGCSASVAAARLGANVTLVEESVWLGGMLTSAGVSAVDGNYRLRSGIFGEFIEALADYYGGWDNINTGWVSKVLFEPHVGEQVFEKMVAAESNITLLKETAFVDAVKTEEGWDVTIKNVKTGAKQLVHAKVLMDCTELGDIAKYVGAEYRIGMEAKELTGEAIAGEENRDVIQDLTMVATLKDYGPDADMTIAKPKGYDPMTYANCCKNPLNTEVFEKNQTLWSPNMMLTYGRLPNGKYMLNWPVEANDIYINLIEMTPKQRAKALEEAKNRTLGYVYFIQTELGYKHLGLADDEYPTKDLLPFIPYHRESRRVLGEAFYIVDAAGHPYDYSFYRAGIAVGDYPVDHHHFAHPQWSSLPAFLFSPVPSFTVPSGVLIPLGIEDFVVAEKSISVSNLVNGSTRLQPMVVEFGQAAGTIAAVAVKSGKKVREVSTREVQSILLENGAYLQPFLDLPKSDPDFKLLQRIGCTGILRGTGKNVNWSNETWFYPGETLRKCDLHLADYYGVADCDLDEPMTGKELAVILSNISGTKVTAPYGKITRLEAARLIDNTLHPFESYDVDWRGNLVK